MGESGTLLYEERAPGAPLNGYIRALWHVQCVGGLSGRERILPNGCLQLILNLARDFIWECPDDERERRLAPSLIVGARSVYEIVDRSDMADLMGIVFEPGGFVPFAGEAVDLFSDRNVSLEDVWGAKAKALRERLVEARGSKAKLSALEQFLVAAFAPRLDRRRVVDFALARFSQSPGLSTVKEVAAEDWLE